jgi:hypothetical protein
MTQCWLLFLPLWALQVTCSQALQEHQRSHVWHLQWWLSDACHAPVTWSFHLSRCWVFVPKF